MAAKDVMSRLQEEATCSICRDFFTEPVTIDCGHNFCRSCLTAYLSCESSYTCCCPFCREEFNEDKLKPNKALNNIVQYIQDLTLQRGECEEHGEKLRFFSQTDGRPMCVFCWLCPEHKVKSEKLIEEAAQKYKNKLESERLKIVTEIDGLRQLLKDAEKTPLGRPEEMDEKIAMAENSNPAKLSDQISSLKALITAIEKNYEQPAGELLKEVRSTLSRCQDVTFQTPEGIRKNYKVRVTLDPDTAHRFLTLSEDGRRLTDTDKDQCWPDNRKRFTSSLSVLGREGFSSGRHYWELQLLRDGGWIVGVARESVNRKKWVTWSPEEGFWTVLGSNGQYLALSSPRCPLSPSQPSMNLGLFLDYGGGRLSIYNTDTMKEIYTFTGAAFTGTIYPYFWLGGEADLRLL